MRILRDMADALAYAHRHGVVHRDIKPENVMLPDRHALVTDFGVAKAVSEATGRQTLTTAGVALGTPAYMAPEQAAADPHTDLWTPSGGRRICWRRGARPQRTAGSLQGLYAHPWGDKAPTCRKGSQRRLGNFSTTGCCH